MAMHAVLTGDIVHSTMLGPRREKKLIRELKRLLEQQKAVFYRGDSFQVYCAHPAEALQLALVCRTAAIGIGDVTDGVPFDIRISIGIGAVTGKVTDLATARGEAFVLSGRAFDALLEAGERLHIAIAHPLANVALQVVANYTNAIFASMTGKQAAVIQALLLGQSQLEVAQQLNKSKSTIHQHVTAGRWAEIDQLLAQYQQIIQLLPS